MSDLRDTVHVTPPILRLGAPCWADLSVPPGEYREMQRFYAHLFGWESHPGDAEDGETEGYAVAHKTGAPVAGLGSLPADMPAGHVPQWIVYFLVDDLEAAVARAEAAGAAFAMGPTPVGDAGRMALGRHDAGGHFALWESAAMPGFGMMNEPGAVCWFEMAAAEGPTAVGFYRAALGLEARDMGQGSYTQLLAEGDAVAGVATAGEWMPACEWEPVFAVADVASSVQIAVEEGAELLSGPTTSPYGSLARLRGPFGEVFRVKDDAPA